MAWAARHRMPLELVRLEDVQPPTEQLALVQRLAAKYRLPLAHQPASADGGTRSGGNTSSSPAEDALVERARLLAQHKSSSSSDRPHELLGRRSLRDSLLAIASAAAEADGAAAEADRGAAQGDEREGVHAVVRDAREWVNKPFSLQKHQSG